MGPYPIEFYTYWAFVVLIFVLIVYLRMSAIEELNRVLPPNLKGAMRSKSAIVKLLFEYPVSVAARKKYLASIVLLALMITAFSANFYWHQNKIEAIICVLLAATMSIHAAYLYFTHREKL